MARAYAGILGYLAMAVTMLRGALHGAGVEGTIVQAVAAMAVMAIVGAVVGAIAQHTVDESVRISLEKELAGDNQTENKAA